jgi:hypothetical protein
VANGDIIDSGRATANAYYTAWKGLDTVTATNVGGSQWIDVRGFPRLTVDVRLGGGTATIQIRGSNAPTKPLNSSDETQIGANITADSIVALDSPIRWIKMIVSTYVSGTINAYINAVEM